MASSDPTGSIPVMRSPADMMEVGLNGDNLASSAVRRHPVDRMQRATTTPEGRMDMDSIRRIYGSGLAMRLTTERRLAANVGGRLMGYGDNYAMLDTLTGDDMRIDFGDILNRPDNNPEISVQANNRGPHGWMEKKLNL
mmetsp:Transcript_4867/g.6940  ORF Transcript_4867/g.6940 Transcript_4867/m.6940 type:complete len:139 (-) Transcript_4867:217-633(-)|eukprot:CAMPEP_0195510878 /NCGR_PEP_ID=MMETSP0794_2-20130614/3393_1 /TAXON_ID=515487 /ORGANISM="Stephanopyxis turris, Strain CCMP 815" /LENGTH=138 /DNA_ID=CAMNT_0040638387 /DNA_START=167 /DNA_END=583 /DNA_ORIENTATION=+